MTNLRRLFLAAAVLVAAGSAAVGLATGAWMLASDIPGFGGEEANVVYTVQQLVAGEPIYTDPGKPPFTITQYSPLFYVVSAGLARALRVEAMDASAITMVCRSVSLTTAVAVALLTFALASVRLRLPRTVGVLVASFAFVSAVPWHFLARPDALMTFFLVLSVYLVLRVEAGKVAYSHASAAAAVVAAFLALLTKQNGAQALGLVFLYLLMARAWKELATALLSAAAAGALLAAFAQPTQNWLGPAVKENLIDGVRNGVDLLAALDRTYAPFFRQFSFLIALTALAAVAFFRVASCPRRRFLGLATFALLAFACGTGLKVGSATNYFIDFVIFAAVTSALYCFPAPGTVPDPHRGGILAPIALVSAMCLLPFVALSQFEICCYAKSLRGTLRPDPRNQFRASEPVARFIRQSLGDNREAFVLTRECFSVGNLLFPLTVVPQPRIAECSHACGVVDYAAFRSAVANGKVCYLVTKAGTRPSEFLGASFSRYRLVREVEGFAVFEFVPDRYEARAQGGP
jgi:hypothetical protein